MGSRILGVPRPVLVLQHAPWESPGLIDVALAGLPVERRTVLDEAEPDLPSARDLAGLVVLGGPQDADDDAHHPGLAAERALLASAVDSGVPVLGVCLGMQLLALALGATLHHGAVREIGFAPVDLEPAAVHDPVLGPLAALGSPVTLMHWHSDIVDLPGGATLLASTPATPVQAFRAGSALGVQLHPEMTPGLLATWLDTPQMSSTLAPGEADQIAADGDAVLPGVRDAALDGFGAFAREVAIRG